jgi:Fe-S-cluster-containing hydrogenase component 2
MQPAKDSDMTRKILIDMVKLRDHQACQVEGVLKDPDFNTEYKSIRELATFLFTCRKCKDAPCISVCPAEALEKDGNEVVTRAINLCVRCKSCIAICPFGTLMDDLFEKKERKYFFNLGDEQEVDRFVEASPDETISFYEGEEDPDHHIYKLTERILVKDFMWNQ